MPKTATLIALDTETTGLGQDARLVEVAAVKYVDGREVDRFATLIDPEIPIPWMARKIHGISDEMVRGMPKAAEALRRLVAFCKGGALIAHNATYDTRVLNAELLRVGLKPLDRQVGCTLGMARRLLPGLPNYKLKTVAEHLGCSTAGSGHRALADARMAGGIFFQLARTLSAALP